jgi:hypothetical protein
MQNELKAQFPLFASFSQFFSQKNILNILLGRKPTLTTGLCVCTLINRSNVLKITSVIYECLRTAMSVCPLAGFF